ncbi:MAG: flavodoxin domain-containing protein [Rhizobiaceae bacterium]|nr:flavodoxin domain-containing protein [Rhizobiaceae bacterium]
MKIGLLYGTETGNSELLCDDIIDKIGDDYECSIANLGETNPSDLDPQIFYIFVTSTYGNGDLPSGAAEFYDKLESQKTDLRGLRFAIFGLGDMVFEYTFAQGSEKLMELLKASNAKMVGERGIHDASCGEMPEDVGLPWLDGILSEIALELA